MGRWGDGEMGRCGNTVRISSMNFPCGLGKGEPARSWGFPP
ncbi:hypothetical protein [Nostoc linckia]|nr:hypothetical protein [Nostoc linckia]